jgi:hypothetical protein
MKKSKLINVFADTIQVAVFWVATLGTTQPLLSNGYQGSFPGLKRPGREADHASSAKVKNAWSCTSIPPCVFMALCLLKCSGAHPASYTMDTRDLSLGVKRPGR